MGIIKSILDNDQYKLSMMKAAISEYPNTIVKYKYKNRSPKNQIFTQDHVDRLKYEIEEMKHLALTGAEKEFLAKKSSYLGPMFLDFLSGYRYDPSEVTVNLVGSEIELTIYGLWYRTILWEVPLMALISEIYFEGTELDMDLVLNNIISKKHMIEGAEINVSDFGTRRRFSLMIHQLVVETLKDVLVGTSNVYLAFLFNLIPIGTHAHEWFMFHGAKYGYRSATYKSLEKWSNVYRGNLGIALTDTYTTDVFLRDFDMYFAKLFDGVRQDSGDEIEFGEKFINHYESMGIDPATKAVIFSNALTIKKCVTINDHFRGKIKDGYGVGTHFSNDVGVTPMNMVIKLSGIYDQNGELIHAVKLSDDKEKNTSDSVEAIENCKFSLGLQ